MAFDDLADAAKEGRLKRRDRMIASTSPFSPGT